MNTSTTTDLSTITSARDIIFSPSAMQQLNQLAILMASSKCTVPQHLQGKTGDCFAIAMQAAQWGMNPFAVAQKTHLVSGILGYEAQLVNAVINTMAPTKSRLKYEWFGDWSKVIGNFKEVQGKNNSTYRKLSSTLADEKGCGVRVSGTLVGEDEPRVLELLLTQAGVRNSTLWADDPKQQLAYLAIKRWSRLYTPDVIMGVYTRDELETIEPPEININPLNNKSKLDELLEAIESFTAEQLTPGQLINLDMKQFTEDEKHIVKVAISKRRKILKDDALVADLVPGEKPNTFAEAEPAQPEPEATKGKDDTNWHDLIANSQSQEELKAIEGSIPKDRLAEFAEEIVQHFDFLRNLQN